MRAAPLTEPANRNAAAVRVVKTRDANMIISWLVECIEDEKMRWGQVVQRHGLLYLHAHGPDSDSEPVYTGAIENTSYLTR